MTQSVALRAELCAVKTKQPMSIFKCLWLYLGEVQFISHFY